MTVLILSSPQDLHAQAVIKKLDEMKVRSRLWCYNEFIQQCVLNFSLNTAGRSCTLKVSDGQELDLYAIDAVWFRRPGHFKAPAFHASWVQSMVETEARQALFGIMRTLPCLWVNHPASDGETSFKLWQLEVARQSGLIIPQTLVANDPDAVRKFYDGCNGQVIYKLVGESTNFAMPMYEFPLGIPTLPLRPADLEHLSQVRFSPHLFQERINKTCDLRVTIVGMKIFAVRIQSQAGQGKLDWRTDYSVPMEVYRLPEQVADGCLRLMRALRLNYGALDFCVDDKGRHVFLEINCAGQYLWLEDKAKVDISQEVANLLAGRSEPLVP